MLDENLFEQLEELKDQDRNAAVAVVVNRKAPTSGKPGDKALITEEGEVLGWIGGGCTKGIVIKEAVASLKDQKPRLVKIAPGVETKAEQHGVKTYSMMCQSEGSVDVYIEPMISPTRIFIFGRSHIAKALCEIGTVSGYDMTVVSNLSEHEMFPKAKKFSSLDDFNIEDIRSKDFVVVCTQGEDDEHSLKAAVASAANYVSFVSSRKKANSIFMSLKRQGVDIKDLAQVKTPAGLDLNAKTPQDVAISILAQIVQEKQAPDQGQETDKAFQQLNEDLYINPVCKIPVQKSTAKYVLEHNGEKVYFCCDGCKVSFEKEPEAYL